MIRSAEPGEVDALVQLWTDCGLDVDRAAGPELARLLGARTGTGTGADLVLVDERTGTLVGTVLGTWDGRRGWLQRLATREEWRHQGVAAGLVDELERRLRDRGCRKLNLLIEPANVAVVPFYERRGFRSDDLTFMERWL